MSPLLLAAALAYAARSWPIFPCSPRTKQPLLKEISPGAGDGGFRRATTDPEQIRAWWRQWPKAMIGVPTGAPMGAFIIDFDLGDPPLITGKEYLDRFIAHVGGLPHTAIAETASGGLHLYFAWDAERPVGRVIRACPALAIAPDPNSKSAKGGKPKGAGVDILGTDGYAIVPPSVRADGRGWKWVQELSDGIAPATPRIFDIALKIERDAARDEPGMAGGRPAATTGGEHAHNYAWAALKEETRKLAQCPSGQRNDALNRAAYGLGQLVGAGALDAAVVRAALESAAGTNGLIRDDGINSVRATIQSGLTDGTKKPRPFASLSKGTRSNSTPPRRMTVNSVVRHDSNDSNTNSGRRGKPPQRDQLIEAALQAELSHWDGEVFATVPVDDRRETYPIRSRAFRGWLAKEFYSASGAAPGGQAIEDAVRVVEAEAFRNGVHRAAFVRVAEHGGCIYLDLADAEWNLVEISSLGWRIIPAARAPVRFIRPRGMRALPRPETGGSLNDLREFINVTDADFTLLLGYIVSLFRPSGPYPILCLAGEHGSAKTTGARVIRSLIDPNAAPVRTVPREERDLLVAARNSWLLCFDNLSELPPWLADAFCRIATGGGFGARALHTDTDEIIFEAKRPIMLNGITDLASRPDLADRSIVLALPAIDDNKRKRESDFWESFEKQWPFLLGAILEAVAVAQGRIHTLVLPGTPRMADFAAWAVAAEPTFGVTPGTFLECYRDNSAGLVEISIENDQVAVAVRELISDVQDGAATAPNGSDPGEWLGSATELLTALHERVLDRVSKSRFFPQDARVLGARLRRIAPALRSVGVLVELGRFNDRDKRRYVRIQLRQTVP